MKKNNRKHVVRKTLKLLAPHSHFTTMARTFSDFSEIDRCMHFIASNCDHGCFFPSMCVDYRFGAVISHTTFI